MASIIPGQGSEYLTPEAARRKAGVGDRRTLTTLGVEPDAWLLQSGTGKRRPLYLRSTIEQFVAEREEAALSMESDGAR